MNSVNKNLKQNSTKSLYKCQTSKSVDVSFCMAKIRGGGGATATFFIMGIKNAFSGKKML